MIVIKDSFERSIIHDNKKNIRETNSYKCGMRCCNRKEYISLRFNHESLLNKCIMQNKNILNLMIKILQDYALRSEEYCNQRYNHSLYDLIYSESIEYNDDFNEILAQIPNLIVSICSNINFGYCQQMHIGNKIGIILERLFDKIYQSLGDIDDNELLIKIENIYYNYDDVKCN